MCEIQDRANGDNYVNDEKRSSHFLIISLERPLMVHASCWIWGIPRLTNILHVLQQIKWLADIKYVFLLQIYVWWVESLKTGKLITKYGDNVNSEPNQHLSMWLDDETQIVLNMLGVKETKLHQSGFYLRLCCWQTPIKLYNTKSWHRRIPGKLFWSMQR